MKRVSAMVLCVLVMFSLMSAPVSAATTLSEFRIKIVDKNDNLLTNTGVTFERMVKGSVPFTVLSDGKGEIRATTLVAGLYKIDFDIPIANKEKMYVRESIKHEFSVKNTKGTVVIKLKGENRNSELSSMENRVDILVKNSKGGAVRNMMVTLIANVDSVQSSTILHTYPWRLSGYTNSEGRLTFINYEKAEYEVVFSWRNGGCKMGKVIVPSVEGVTEFVLAFDEKLLEKK